MSERRCATAGCPGTLPAGIGTHCPRCGGTEFLGRKRNARKRAVVLILVAFAVVVSLITARQSRRAPRSSAHSQALIEAHDVAGNMTSATARDDAFADIVKRALAKHDYEYACQVANEMTMSNARDKSLKEILEDTLKSHETHWAKVAAESMIQTQDRDAALRRIMDAGQGKD